MIAAYRQTHGTSRLTYSAVWLVLGALLNDDNITNNVQSIIIVTTISLKTATFTLCDMYTTARTTMARVTTNNLHNNVQI